MVECRNVLIVIINYENHITRCMIYNTTDKTIYDESMFTFKGEPADKDINGISKFVGDYVIPHFKNNNINFTNCYIIPHFSKEDEREAFENGMCVLTNTEVEEDGGGE